MIKECIANHKAILHSSIGQIDLAMFRNISMEAFGTWESQTVGFVFMINYDNKVPIDIDICKTWITNKHFSLVHSHIWKINKITIFTRKTHYKLPFSLLF